MNLLFLGRDTAAPAPGLSFLNVRPDGSCSLSSGAITHHQLQNQKWVRVAKDADTNRFFLVFDSSKPAGDAFALRAQHGKAPATRCFNAGAPARQLCEAFLLGSTKSLRLYLGQPLQHEAGNLYPLTREEQVLKTVAAAAVASTAPGLAAGAEPVSDVSEGMSETAQEPASAGENAPRKAWRTEELDYLKQHYPTSSLAQLAAALPGRTEATINWKASMLKLKKAAPAAAPDSARIPVSTPAPTTQPVREEAPAEEAPRKTFGLVARAEELTEHWHERELSSATPNELGEILNLLRHVSKDKRSVLMGLVLDRAEAEHTNRLKGAGKGGNRG